MEVFEPANARTISSHDIRDLKERCQSLSDALHKCRAEYTSLRNRYAALADAKPIDPSAITVLPCETALVSLRREAIMRKLRPDVFCRQLLEAIAEDNLFAAVLDR